MYNLVLLLASFFVLGAAQAQKKKSKSKKKAAVVKTVTPPSKVNAAFNARFASLGEVADQKWNKNLLGNYIVTYKNAEALKQTVEYKADGSFVKSATELDLNNIPEVVKSAVDTKYTGAGISEVKKLEVNDLKPYYKVKILADGKEKNVLISEDGTITES